MSGKGYVVKAMTVTIGAVSYECEITGLTVTPTQNIQTTVTACADGGITDAGPATYTLDITANVVLDPTSLFVLLTTPANIGTTAHVEWKPDATNKPLVVRQADVTLVAVGESLTPGDWATFDVSLPVKVGPTWKVAPTMAEAEAEPEPAGV